MKIDSGSLAFNINVNGKVGGTPSWGTAIVYQTEDNKIKEDIATDILIGMIYKKIDCTSSSLSLPLGKGGHVYHGDEDFSTNGAPSTPYLAARFEKTYVNGKSINKPFILLIMKDAYDAHDGRLQLKYSPKIMWGDYKNQEFFDEAFKVLGINSKAPFVCYAIDVIDQDSLHFRCAYKDSEYKFRDSKEYVDFINHAIKEDTFQIPWTPIIDVKTSYYRPYITAIKSKPFLLLAGISGTGKSRIVRELARSCWEEGTEEYKAHKPMNFEMVQVKPNWHDSSELIGYVSRLSGKPEFIVGDFLKFVAKAWENIEIPYFLCLDEMNLAPVEQYFAEYLSVIESRKFQDDGTVMTDAIFKKVDEEWYFNLTAQLTSNEAIRQQFNTNGITIPQNLIVVGTVNMDETTFSFSRKVLDRAMTIEMNEVDLNGGLEKRNEQIGKLGKAELIGTAVEGVDIYESNKDVCDKVITYLQKINDKLEGTPFKVAYRTRNEFLLYVVNNLPYKQEGKSEDFVIQRALDEITSMKVLSRIEGDETKVSRTFLNSLEEVIKTALPEILEKDSVSLKKLTEMKKRLESGYTSFWS